MNKQYKYDIGFDVESSRYRVVPDGILAGKTYPTKEDAIKGLYKELIDEWWRLDNEADNIRGFIDYLKYNVEEVKEELGLENNFKLDK